MHCHHCYHRCQRTVIIVVSDSALLTQHCDSAHRCVSCQVTQLSVLSQHTAAVGLCRLAAPVGAAGLRRHDALECVLQILRQAIVEHLRRLPLYTGKDIRAGYKGKISGARHQARACGRQANEIMYSSKMRPGIQVKVPELILGG